MVTSVVTAFYRDWNVMATSIVKAFYRDRNVMVTPVVTAFYMKRDGYISTVSILQRLKCDGYIYSCATSWGAAVKVVQILADKRSLENGNTKLYQSFWHIYQSMENISSKKNQKKTQKQNINCKSSGNLNCLQWLVIPHVGGVSSASNVHLMHTIKTPTVKTDLWSTNPSLSVRSKCSHLSNHEQSHTCN